MDSLLNPALWEFVDSGNLQSSGTGSDRLPIPAITIAGLTGKAIRIKIENPTAAANWNIGAVLSQKVQIGDDEITVKSETLYLRQEFLFLPVNYDLYQLFFRVPRYFNNFNFTVYQYTGDLPQSSGGLPDDTPFPGNLTGFNNPDGVVVSASSYYQDPTIAAYPWSVFDRYPENLTLPTLSVWSSNGDPLPQWVAINLGRSFFKSKVQITTRIDGLYNNLFQSPKNFRIDSSNDGVDWFTRLVVVDANWESGETKTFYLTTPGAAQYWRVYVTDTLGSPYVSIAELK